MSGYPDWNFKKTYKRQSCSLHGIWAGQSGNGTGFSPKHFCSSLPNAIPPMPHNMSPSSYKLVQNAHMSVAVSRDSISSHSYHNSHKYYTFGRYVQPAQTVFTQRL